METRLLYRPGLWEAIANHPDYDLGRRELAALTRFLPTVATHASISMDVFHFASSTGREIPAIVTALPSISNYLLNDIVPEVVGKAYEQVKVQFPHIRFWVSTADIEMPGVCLPGMCFFRRLVVLVGNGTIFASRQMDRTIYQMMRKNDWSDDMFLLTLEEPHGEMFASYLIPPVFELLSQIGKRVDVTNTKIWYDSQTSMMHMACGGEDLLVSYKPTAERLHQRMLNAGFVEVAVERYADLHMLAGLYGRK